MPGNSEGYIKFICSQESEGFVFPDEYYSVLEKWRYYFFGLKLIGAYPDGIGFGNISVRYDQATGFIISASATGNFPHLQKEQYSQVTQFDITKNSLKFAGKLKATSESLSHAAIYECCKTVNAVIHIHNRKMWDELKYQQPTTNDRIEYGTPDMAWEIQRIISEFHLENGGFIVMGGHKEGLIAFGKDLEVAAGFISGKLPEPGI
jgi:L-ribulose-5-phosphate 4-epimerase